MAGSATSSNDDQLLALARARFSDLKPAELKLLRALPDGELATCGPSAGFEDRTNDPSNALDEPTGWGEDREIRAEVIRWLCVDGRVRELVDPKGIRVLGAKITGSLDLQNVSAPFALNLWRSRLLESANLQRLEIPELDFQGTWTRSISADGLKVRGNLSFRHGFRAEGEVRIVGAQIEGNFSCHSGTFTNPPKEEPEATGRALTVDRGVVKGSVFLNWGFHAEGLVRLVSMRIGGNLDCNNGVFANPPKKALAASGIALGADGIYVEGGVLLGEGFRAEGEVRLLESRIGTNFDCALATLTNPPKQGTDSSGRALVADGIDVRGSVFLRKGFRAEGNVRLLSAQIGGDLDCTGGIFMNPLIKIIGYREDGGDALSADGVNVGGTVFLSEGFRAEGLVRLVGAQINGALDCSGASFHGGLIAQGAVIKQNLYWKKILDPDKLILALVFASVDALVDDRQSWPALGNLILDGFVYGHISDGPKDAKSRLDWLRRQKEFRPQPYRQLAKVLREEGDYAGSREVLFELEKKRRSQENHNWIATVWGFILRVTVGYGHYPGWTFYWLAGLVLLGFGLFCGGYYTESVAPTNKETYAICKKGEPLPPYYPRFHASIYSLENTFPLVKLGQADHWQPDPDSAWATKPGHASTYLIFSPWFLSRFLWLQICLGWVLATFFVAAVSGIVHKE